MKKFFLGVLVVFLAGAFFVGSTYIPTKASETVAQGTIGQKNSNRPGFGAGFGARDGGLITTVSDLTGLTVEEIASRRIKGKSLAAIAKEEGVSTEKIVEKALEQREQFLEDLVERGIITKEVAEARSIIMKERIKSQLERTTVGPQGKGRGFGKGRGAGRAGACLNILSQN